MLKSLEIRGYRDDYLNLKRAFLILRSYFAGLLETFGDCCLEINSKSKFMGDKQVLLPGGFIDDDPDFQFVSLRGLEPNHSVGELAQS